MHQEIIEKMLQDKLEEAKQNGIAEGRELALFDTAKSMSANGCDIDLISRVTGLSIAKVWCIENKCSETTHRFTDSDWPPVR